MTLREMLDDLGSPGSSSVARWVLLGRILVEICEALGVDLDLNTDFGG